jgi:hypothetical protein
MELNLPFHLFQAIAQQSHVLFQLSHTAHFKISLTFSQINHSINIILNISYTVRLAIYMYLNLFSTIIILCVPPTNSHTIKSTNLSHICSFWLWSVLQL